MKILLIAMILVMSLLTSAAPRISTPANGPSSNGDFQFSIGDGPTRYVQFNAQIQHDGSTNGHLTFSGPSSSGDTDVDGDGTPDEAPTDFLVQVDFDCLTVNGNRAVMSGLVTESTQARLVGNRVLLVVEDNGEGNNQPQPDRLTWGLYRHAATGWIPVDAEREDDDGALLTWTATDFEREDDTGIPAGVSTGNQTVGCHTFSLSSYAFHDVQHGNGNIQVKP